MVFPFRLVRSAVTQMTSNQCRHPVCDRENLNKAVFIYIRAIMTRSQGSFFSLFAVLGRNKMVSMDLNNLQASSDFL